MQNVIAIILGGGRGSRLYPLTKYRAKPALPLAGKYRLIDIPLSNCINSEIRRIFVLTQFNSASLNNHVSNTYRFSPFSEGFVQVLAAQQTPVNPDWFQGTADAVRKVIWVMKPWKVEDYIILAGDHLYRMDYRKFIAYHKNTKADVTIGVIPVGETQANGLGLMKTDQNCKVIEFKEKPPKDALLNMKVDTQIFGLDSKQASEKPYIASMGIYVFKRDVLFHLLETNQSLTDFGRDIIPLAISEHRVMAYLFNGYWEDIGTLDTFYQTNLALVKQPNPVFSFYDIEFPIYTRPRFLPPTKILNSSIVESMVCDGCIVKSSRLVNSIVGIRSRLENNCIIENSLLMGADYYQSDNERESDIASGIPPIGIGANSVIRNAIIDKNARIGKNVQILNQSGIDNSEQEDKGFWIRNGLIIIMKDTIIPDNTII